MLRAILNSWALLLGIFMLMIGNGLQSTLLGVRGGTEGFTDTTLGFVMAGYFVGFLGGTRVTPWLLRRVGHVRVFAALASLISAAFILYAEFVYPVAWVVLRIIVGFCISGVYVVAESWLNDSATNETRGQTMSAYITAQMLGIILAQLLLNVGDPNDYVLFVVMSVLVSVSFLPILLSSGPAPLFEQARAMSLKRLFATSPLGCVAIFLVGAIFAVQFGMSAVYAAGQGFGLLGISIFVSVIYLGGLLWQPPVGWLSDRVDRRSLIITLTVIGALGCVMVPLAGASLAVVLAGAFIMGGASNGLYSLTVAYVNDYLAHEDMPGASAGLIMLNGIGAMGAPILVGYLMESTSDDAYFLFLSAAFGMIALYALWRARRRPVRIIVGEQGPVIPMSQVASQVAADVALEAAIEQEIEQAQADESTDGMEPPARAPHDIDEDERAGGRDGHERG